MTNLLAKSAILGNTTLCCIKGEPCTRAIDNEKAECFNEHPESAKFYLATERISFPESITAARRRVLGVEGRMRIHGANNIGMLNCCDATSFSREEKREVRFPNEMQNLFQMTNEIDLDLKRGDFLLYRAQPILGGGKNAV